MPLVVPGLMSGSSSKTEDWQNKLLGKKLGDTSDSVVRNFTHLTSFPSILTKILTKKQTFAKTELPSEHRVVKEGDFTTMDHKPDR